MPKNPPQKIRGTKNFLSVQYIKLLYTCNYCRTQIYTCPPIPPFSLTQTKLYFKHLFFIIIILGVCRCLQGCRGEKGTAAPSSASDVDLEPTKSPPKTVNSALSITRTPEEPPNLQNSHSKKTNRETTKSYGAPTVQKYKLWERKKETHAFLVWLFIKLYSHTCWRPS